MTCYFLETVICRTCPCHWVSVMPLIIFHSLSDVFASNRWIWASARAEVGACSPSAI